MGYREYEPISERYKVPIVITGFEPLDLLQGTLMVVRQLEAGRAVVENQYSRILDREGNVPARKLVNSVFEVSDRKWRGVGWISEERLQAALGVSRSRRRAHLRGERDRHARNRRSASAGRY